MDRVRFQLVFLLDDLDAEPGCLADDLAQFFGRSAVAWRGHHEGRIEAAWQAGKNPIEGIEPAFRRCHQHDTRYFRLLLGIQILCQLRPLIPTLTMVARSRDRE